MKFVKSFKEEDLKNLLNPFLYFQEILRYQKRFMKFVPLVATSNLPYLRREDHSVLLRSEGVEPPFSATTRLNHLVYETKVIQVLCSDTA